MSTTNNRVREHFEGDSPYVATDSPGNGAATTVGETTRTHLVSPDGDNEADLDAAAREGHEVTVVHDGDAAGDGNVTFADGDFVGTGPSNLTDPGATATVRNIDGSTSGWVVVATGSA